MIKQSISDLAIFGGKPAFDHMLHVGRPNVGNRDRFIERVNELLDRRWFTNRGPFVQELEEGIQDRLGVKHCIAMCNGTIGLEIAIRALGLTGEVIVPAFTFIATAHSLQWQAIKPVFCDVDTQTHNIDPAQVEQMITPLTTGIIGVHLWGRPANIDRLQEISDRNNLKLLFDAAHAFNCTYKGKMIGNFGDAEVFSFHATKFFNTFEGGAVTTNNDELAEKIRLMQNFGFMGLDNVVYIGTNGKLHEVSAAMGLTGLESLEQFIDVNYRNYKRYQVSLDSLPGIKLHTFPEDEKNNYQYIVLEIEENDTGISRDRIVEILHSENVRARRYFYPGCHKMEPYKSYFPHAGLLLPVTEKLVGRVMTLPTGTAVKEEQIGEICELLSFIVENSRSINENFNESNDSKE